MDLQTLPLGTVIIITSVLGLLFGSFLNVVIYRTPKKIDQEQDEAVAAYLEEKISKQESLEFLPIGYECAHCKKKDTLSKHAYILAEQERSKPADPITLSKPRSACPKCGHKIAWYENIPILSWLFLRGKCSSCKTPISIRYPMIELLTGVLFGYVAWRFGATIQTVLWCYFVFMCIAISGIDWDTTWLPDSLSLPLMWVGIIAAVLGWTAVSIPDAIWGAVAGYLSLWIIAKAFHLITGREGMGHGDFKLLAALGAWFGWQFLLPILLLSSVVGIIVYIALKLLQSQVGLFENKQMPFGPFLAGAGLFLLIITPQFFLEHFSIFILPF